MKSFDAPNVITFGLIKIPESWVIYFYLLKSQMGGGEGGTLLTPSIWVRWVSYWLVLFRGSEPELRREGSRGSNLTSSNYFYQYILCTSYWIKSITLLYLLVLPICQPFVKKADTEKTTANLPLWISIWDL